MAVREMALNTLNTRDATEHGRPAPGDVHHGECGCPRCPRGTRAGHRRALASFRQRRDELASKEAQFVPHALAHSPTAARQWVSDELTQAAHTVADRADQAAATRSAASWHRTVALSWGAALALALAQVATASGSGWTATRTATLLAMAVVALALSLGAYLHRSRRGPLAALVGADNRFSTSLAVAACWTLVSGYAVLSLAVLTASGSPEDVRLSLADGGGPLLAVTALTGLLAVLTRRLVARRVRGQRLQKTPAQRPRAADVLTDDAGRGSFADIQYVVVNASCALFVCVAFARRPDRLPELSWSLALLVALSAAVYLAAKWAEGGRPVILSVVRSREIGDLDGPLRTGDDVEIRGAGFLPPGADSPEQLTRLVVRIGTVYAHVPLVPVSGGFRNPADGVLTVPLPAEVEPGRTEVQVITATGAETNRYPVDIVD